MSKMGNLFLELSEKLEKESPAFKEALECDCEVCEDIKEQAIQTAFEEYSKANGFYKNLNNVKAIYPCEICGKAVAISGRLYKSDNGQTVTVRVCGSCVTVHEASKC